MNITEEKSLKEKIQKAERLRSEIITAKDRIDLINKCKTFAVNGVMIWEASPILTPVGSRFAPESLSVTLFETVKGRLLEYWSDRLNSLEEEYRDL